MFDRAGNNWLGMVVGGDRDFMTSVAVEAKPLLDYLRLCLAAGIGQGRRMSGKKNGPVSVSSYEREG